MNGHADLPVTELQRFARLAGPLLCGTATAGVGTRASNNRPGPGLEFLDLTAFRPGDDVRHIDWRHTARRQRPVVRRYRDESASDWVVCVDCSPSVRLFEDKWGMTARVSAALVYALLHAGHRVGLVLFDAAIEGVIDRGRGSRQYAAAVAALASIDDMDRQPHPGERSRLGLCSDYLRRNDNVFVVSDFLEPDRMRGGLRAIRAAAASASALQVLAPDELPPTSGCVALLRDVESGRGMPVQLSADAVRHAHEALAQHQQSLRADCRSLDVRFATCLADARWDRVLLDYFRGH